MTRNELTEEILKLVNASEDLTYSDIQGIAMAISMKAIPSPLPHKKAKHTCTPNPGGYCTSCGEGRDHS